MTTSSSGPGLPRESLFVQTACIWEVMSRKLGNVHRSADFAQTSCVDFLVSAAAIGPWLRPWGFDGPGLGSVILRAVEATHAAVGQNTNLGIVLLLAPLACIAADQPLRAGVASRLADLTVEDARQVYAAIRLANPAGLGEAPEQDVRGEPSVTLGEAMRLAAERDMIARQYATGFADIFDFGVPRLVEAFARWGCVEAAVIDNQLRWLAAFPDSLLARKAGLAAAEAVQRRAQEILHRGGLDSPAGRHAAAELDRWLRSDGHRYNPGTTADLIAAGLYVALRDDMIPLAAPFPWAADDWLTS